MVDVVALPEAVARPAPEADADEYLEWLRELVAPDRAELLDGDLVVSRAPDPEHQDAGGSLYAWLLLWALYLSFVNVGQVFYGFGWESLLLEAGALAVFLGPAGCARGAAGGRGAPAGCRGAAGRRRAPRPARRWPT